MKNGQASERSQTKTNATHSVTYRRNFLKITLTETENRKVVVRGWVRGVCGGNRERLVKK